MFPPPGVETSSPPPSRRPKRQKSTAADDNLTLPFGGEGWNQEEPPSDEKTLEPEEAEAFTLGVTQPAEPEFDGAPDAEVEEEEEDDDDRRDLGAPPMPPPRDLSFAAEPAPVEAAPRREENEERGKFWFLCAFLVAVVSAYGLVYKVLSADPAMADRLLADLPVLGEVTTEKLLARNIMVVDVDAKYSFIHNGRHSEVFTIDGNALSTASAPLHSVRVMARILNSDGATLDEKAVYCGNTVSADVSNDLNSRQTAVLQRIQPPPRFSLSPGDSKPFTIVFLNPPKGIASYTVEAVAAQK